MSDVIRDGRQEPLLPGVTARPWSPVHEECYREIEQAERDLGEALAHIDGLVHRFNREQIDAAIAFLKVHSDA